MTSGVYPRKPGLWAGNGGKRRNSPPPKLDYAQAQAVRLMHEAGTRMKLICRAFEVSPWLVYQVVNQQGAYR